MYAASLTTPYLRRAMLTEVEVDWKKIKGSDVNKKVKRPWWSMEAIFEDIIFIESLLSTDIYFCP